MRYAIFSDIHGNLQALETIMEDIKKNEFDKVICLGDVIALGPNSKECLDIIINNNVNMVLGNHELYYLKGTSIDNKIENGEKEHQLWVSDSLNDKHFKFLNKCPITLEEENGSDKIDFQHFLIKNVENQYPFENIEIVKNDDIYKKIEPIDARYIFIGHEHEAFQTNIDNKTLIDVGSSGCIKENETFYTILTIDKENVNIEKKILKFDRKEFDKTMNESHYPEKSIISKIFFGIN